MAPTGTSSSSNAWRASASASRIQCSCGDKGLSGIGIWELGFRICAPGSKQETSLGSYRAARCGQMIRTCSERPGCGKKIDFTEARWAFEIGRQAANARLVELKDEVRAVYPDDDAIALAPVLELALAWVRGVSVSRELPAPVGRLNYAVRAAIPHRSARGSHAVGKSPALPPDGNACPACRELQHCRRPRSR